MNTKRMIEIDTKVVQGIIELVRCLTDGPPEAVATLVSAIYAIDKQHKLPDGKMTLEQGLSEILQQLRLQDGPQGKIILDS